MRVRHRLFRRRSFKGTMLLVGIPLALLAGGGATYAALSIGGGPQGAINLQSGLVSWWKFDGNAKDSTPYANNGSIQGVVSLTTDREGQSNHAYSFDGSTGYITTTNLITNPQTFTISAWFNTSTTRGGKIIGFGTSQTGNSANYDRHIYMSNSGQLYFGAYPGSIQTINSSASYNNGSWHNVVASLSSAGVALYVDGQSVASSSSITSAQVDNGYWRIGEDNLSTWTNAPTSYFFNGSIDDVRIYNRVLSAAEVKALYNQYNPSVNVASGENGLVGWWKLNGNAKDSTPYGDNGTVSGATLTTDRHGQANSAYSAIASNNAQITVANGPTVSSTATISGWFYWNSGNTYNSLIRDNTCTGGWILGYLSGSDVAFREDGSSFVTSTVITPYLNQWALYTMTVSGGNVAYYINGTQVYTSSGAGSTASALPWHFMENGSCSQYMTASASDIRIYNVALTASQVSTLYNLYNSEIALGGTGVSGGINLGQGLVGQWNFVGNAKDSTPYADNGTVTGATLTTDRHGLSNSAYSFSGTSTYITLPTSAALNVGTYTYCAWVDPSNVSGTTETIIGPSTNGNSQFRINNGQLQLLSSNVVSIAFSTGTISNGVWSFVCASYNSSGNYAFYINGALSGSGTNLKTLTLSGNFLFGAKATGTSEPYHGVIGKIRIYNRVLSSAEINALYQEY